MSHRIFLRAVTTFAAVVTLGFVAGCASIGDADLASNARPPVTSTAELGPDDGFIPPGETARISDDVPAVTRLEESLKNALTVASTDALIDRDIDLTFVEGWRSARYQQYLFEQAVTKYGTVEEASRWVKPGNQSKHTFGQAVDVATADAMDWLSRFGSEYGLCQVYANEAWHYELVADPSGTRPAQLTDGSAG